MRAYWLACTAFARVVADASPWIASVAATSSLRRAGLRSTSVCPRGRSVRSRRVAVASHRRPDLASSRERIARQSRVGRLSCGSLSLQHTLDAHPAARGCHAPGDPAATLPESSTSKVPGLTGASRTSMTVRPSLRCYERSIVTHDSAIHRRLGDTGSTTEGGCRRGRRAASATDDTDAAADSHVRPVRAGHYTDAFDEQRIPVSNTAAWPGGRFLP